MKLTECLNTLEPNELASFWQFIESVKWSPGTNCKERLLKNLSPQQSARYKRILNFICETLAEELSLNYNFNKIFDAKAYCSNIIGEKGYNGLLEIEQNIDRIVEKIELHNFNDIDDVFLLMVPDDDDYWY